MTEPEITAPKPSRRRGAPAAPAPETPSPAMPEAAEEPSPADVPSVASEDIMAPTTASPALVEKRSGEGLDRVAVSSLHVERGGIGEAAADSVDLRMGGIGRLDAEDVRVQFGGIGAARADALNVQFGSVGLAGAGELHVSQGIASNVIAREATIERGFVRTIVAQHVTVSGPSAALFVLAARVDGEVRALLDWRGALALGLGFGLVAALARTLRKAR